MTDTPRNIRDHGWLGPAMHDKAQALIAENKLVTDTPRAYTVEEVRADYMHHFKTLARYWANLPDKTPLERTEGLLFSIYTTFDGCSPLPAVNLSVHPHPSDKEYNIDCGDNWYEPGQVFNDTVALHEIMSTKDK